MDSVNRMNIMQYQQQYQYDNNVQSLLNKMEGIPSNTNVHQRYQQQPSSNQSNVAMIPNSNSYNNTNIMNNNINNMTNNSNTFLEPTPLDNNSFKVMNNFQNGSGMQGDGDMQLAMFCLSPLVNHNGDQSDSATADNDTAFDEGSRFSDFQSNRNNNINTMGSSNSAFQGINQPEDDVILLSDSMIQFSKDFQPYTSANMSQNKLSGYGTGPVTGNVMEQHQLLRASSMNSNDGNNNNNINCNSHSHNTNSSSWLFDSDSLFDVTTTASHGKSSDDWVKRFQELCLYKHRFGTCAVPHDWKENRALANWVKRQRYQYSLKKAGKHSTLTDARQQALEQIGFRWKLHKAMWNERFNELKAFREANGHCNVPSRYPPNPTLAIWVQSQRRQYKLFMKKKTSHMTMERIERLTNIGFEWSGRDASTKKT